MNIFEKILYFIKGEMERPKPWGWYHILWILLMFIVIILLYKVRNKYSEKQLKIVLATYGIIAFILELLKQLIWAFNYDQVTGIVTWEYSWYSAPFQLCTTPIYVSLICLFLKKNKIRTSLLSYICFYTILGSLATILMPTTVFTETILVNIHTMYLHFGSFVLSVYLLMNKEVKLELKNLIRAFYVFIIFVLIAEVLNISFYNSKILNGNTFNMFYISPYFISELPVFDIIQKETPFIFYIFFYIFMLSLGATIIYGISLLIEKLTKKKR